LNNLTEELERKEKYFQRENEVSQRKIQKLEQYLKD